MQDMPTYSTVLFTKSEPVAAGRWDAFVRQHPRGHILQTSGWGQLKERHGWRCARACLQDSRGQLLSTILLLTRRLPYGLGRIAYVPHGPVVNWDNLNLARETLRATIQLARAQRAFAVVIEPDLLDTAYDRRQLTQYGLRPLPFDVQPRRTIWVNLDVDEEVDLLAAMKPKTRYNIGLARRRGVIVRDGNSKDAPLFYQLLRATASRDQFNIFPQRYYQDFLDIFLSDEAARLLIAEHEGEPLAAVIVSSVGQRATYLYGGSSNHKRELMPTYLLQWEAMRWARSRGCNTYDLWGVPDEDVDQLEAQFEQRNDGLWGVYRFKRGFGGQVVRYIGAWVAVLSPIRWWLYLKAQSLHKSTGLAA